MPDSNIILGSRLRSGLQDSDPKSFGSAIAWLPTAMNVIRSVIKSMDLLPPKDEVLEIVRTEVGTLLKRIDFPRIPNVIEDRVDEALVDSAVMIADLAYDFVAGQ